MPQPQSTDAKKEQVSTTYDEMFAKGGSGGVFDMPYRRSPYFPLFKVVRRELLRFKPEHILEVGSGTGAFAHYFLDTTTGLTYRGFDFSPVAVQKASARTGRAELFFVGDATEPSSYAEPYDAIVCTEVLEHVHDDMALVARWAPGTACVCSVPNYDSQYHVRYFATEHDVSKRYGTLIDIERIVRIKKPVLDDVTAGNLFRELRWNRYRLGRLRNLLGLGNFEAVGGWFVLTGTKR